MAGTPRVTHHTARFNEITQHWSIRTRAAQPTRLPQAAMQASAGDEMHHERIG
jgi:hypothetical protein